MATQCFTCQQTDKLGGEVRITDPETGGQKGSKPERHSLRPQWPQDEVARVYGYGAQKYEDHNWRRGYSWSLSLDAHARHVAKFRSGESIDPESGRHHLAHAQFHLDVLMEFERLGLGTDDRVDTLPLVNVAYDLDDENAEDWSLCDGCGRDWLYCYCNDAEC